MKRINSRNVMEGRHDPYGTFRRNQNANDSTINTCGYNKIRNIPLWGDGVRMTKLTTLMDYMQAHKLETIEIDNAASVMNTSNQSAYQMINKCSRFERESRGEYRLLPKNDNSNGEENGNEHAQTEHVPEQEQEKEKEQTPETQPDTEHIDADDARPVATKPVKLTRTKPEQIKEYMARKGMSEIRVPDVAELLGVTYGNASVILSNSPMFKSCGRRTYRLLQAHTNTGKENSEDADLGLDEKMARSKMSEDPPEHDKEPEQRDEPDESMPAQEDTTADEDKMKLIKEGNLSVPIDMKEDAEKEQKDGESKEQEDKYRSKLSEEAVAHLRGLIQKEIISEMRKSITEEVIEQITMRTGIRIVSRDDAPEQTAQPAPEPRKVIRLCLCPHCGKQIITD